MGPYYVPCILLSPLQILAYAVLTTPTERYRYYAHFVYEKSVSPSKEAMEPEGGSSGLTPAPILLGLELPCSILNHNGKRSLNIGD